MKPEKYAVAAPDASSGEKLCDHCGVPFLPKRRHARFHSDACRRLFHRAKKATADLLPRVEAIERRLEDLERRLVALVRAVRGIAGKVRDV
jgi:hypothetical protein